MSLGDVGQRRARADRAASDQNQRALGLRKALRGLVDRRRIGHRPGGSAADVPVGRDAQGKHVPRQRQMHRTRPAAAKHRIGARDEFRQLFGIADHGAEGGEAGGHRRLVLEFVDRSPALAVGERGTGSR